MTEISIKAEELFRIGSWPVTNSLLLALVSLVVLAVTAFALHRKLALIPGKLQGIFEMFADEMLGLMDSVLGGRAMSEKYFPLIASVFTFILISNWLGLLPVVGSVGIREDHSFIPLFRAPAADLNFTVVLAIVSVFAVQILGVVAVGAGKHFSKYFTLKNPILTLVPFILPLPFLFLEVFVGFVQALIFAMLTLVFVAMAVREHEAH